MRISINLVIICSHVAIVNAAGLSSKVAASCLYAMKELPSTCASRDLDYKCRCSNSTFVGSVLSCIETQAEDYNELSKAYSFIEDICTWGTSQNFAPPRLKQIMINSTLEVEDRMTVGAQNYNVSLASVISLLDHRTKSTYFGIGLLFYWVIVLAFGIVANVFAWCSPLRKMKLQGVIPNWFRRHILIPHLLNFDFNTPKDGAVKRQINRMGKSLPSRIEALVLAFYLICITVFSCVCYSLQTPNVIFADHHRQLLVYIGDRCGIIATFQIPLLFAFAGRNNFLVYLTGWNYKNFNMFHRLISRVVWLMLLIHAATYVAFTCLNEDYHERWHLYKWRWAHVGLICSALAILVSLNCIRKRYYEVFKSSHQLLALFFLVGAWEHCKTLGWMEPLYATSAIWAFDRVGRVMKIVASGGVVKAKCEAIVNPSSDQKEVQFISITINHSGSWRCFPGCYVYLYLLKSTMFWESHPFTLLEPTKIENANQLVILVKVKNGLTKRLGLYLETQANMTAIIPVLVEGPYGSPIPFRYYENTVFIAGGIGITVVYTFAMDLIRQYKAEMSRDEGDRMMHLTWVTTHVTNIESFANEIKALNDTGFTTITIFITRDTDYVLSARVLNERNIESQNGDEKNGQDDNVQNGSAKSDISERQHLCDEIFSGQLPMIRIEFSRPDMRRLLRRQIRATLGTLAIVSCGPDKLNRDVRKVVAASVDLPQNDRIDYFEEQLLW